MKTINRHNYEEFFLLYADKELSAEERIAVELFVEQNSDLSTEFEMINQSILSTDEHILFNHKADLYRTENLIINNANYENYFLLYIDNELSQTERESVEKFVLRHPALQVEFTLLRETVVAPETITFSDKRSLYRHDNEERKVIPFNWQRLAVAAAFIGLGIFGLWVFSSPENRDNFASSSIISKPIQGTDEKGLSIHVPFDNTSDQQVDAIKINNDSKKSDPYIASKKNNFTSKPKAAPASNNGANTIEPEKILASNISSSSNQHNNSSNTNIIAVPDEQVSSNSKNADPDVHIVNTNTANQNNTQNELALPLVYKELDTKQDDRSLYVGALNLNKDKVKGLFRKVGQLFTDKTRSISNNEDGNLQVANLEFGSNK